MIELLRELRQSLSFPKKAVSSLALSLAPVLAHLVLNLSGLGFLLNSIITLGLIVGVAGLISGYAFGFVSVAAGPAASGITCWLAIQLRFAGNGGDGDMYFVIMVGGAILFMFTSFLAALLATLQDKRPTIHSTRTR